MPHQIQGSQTDFSYGEIDVALKRADQHPARKAGLRQMANTRILNSGAIQDRPGRRALFPSTSNRIEKIMMSSGNAFKIVFAPNSVAIRSNAGVVLQTFTLQGNGAALPWVSQADISLIVYAIFNLQIVICFGNAMRPQVISWDGVAAWSIADYTELVIGSQKRTPFYRISPQGIGLLPGAVSGSTSLVASAPLFTAAHVGTRMRFVNRQMLITAVADNEHATVTVEETLPGFEVITFGADPSGTYSIGDEVIGSVSGSKGLVLQINAGANKIGIQLISTNSTVVTTGFYQQQVQAFTIADTIVGPGGGLPATIVDPLLPPQASCTFWDEEVINPLRGYPASVFVDQFRLGFTNFSAVPGGVAWSAINSPTDLYVGANSDNAMFEIAPGKVQIYFVVPGPEGSEFVFADKGVSYIPINETNPLRPGSVAFKKLSGDGAARVQPRLAQEAILYINAGGNSPMAVIATGAYLRPFNTKNLGEFHAHLFNNVQCIAAPGADGTFNERYAYVLNGDGSIAVGKYNADTLPSSAPVIGWGPWSGGGAVRWISAWDAEVYFTSSYFGAGVCEVLDDTQYLDCAINVNAPTVPFTPPAGKGPLWFIPSQTVTLIDQVTRAMGTYQTDVNGFIVPQNNGGENLAIASLVAGQPWTMTVEPFAPDATTPGVDMHQRMELRQFSKFAVYVINSTGFKFASLFSAKQLPTSPPLGAIMQYRRVPAFNQGDDATKPPFLRETVESWTPSGSSYDPRVAIIKDTPGPLQILEIGMEVSI